MTRHVVASRDMETITRHDTHGRNMEPRVTGRRVAQPGGYKAFVPLPLPPDPPVRLEGDLLALLSRADRALGRLDGVIQTLPDSDLFMFMYVRKEAVLSSQIEGTQSSLHDVLAAESRFLSSGVTATWPR